MLAVSVCVHQQGAVRNTSQGPFHPAAGLCIYYEKSYGWVGIAVPGILWLVGCIAVMFVPQVSQPTCALLYMTSGCRLHPALAHS